MKKHGILVWGIAAVFFAVVLLGCGGGSRSTDSYSRDGFDDSGAETEEAVNADLEPEYFFGEWMDATEVGIGSTVAISQDKFRWDDLMDESYQEMAVDNWEPAPTIKNSDLRGYYSGGFKLTGKTKSNVADRRVNEITVYLSNDGQFIMFLNGNDQVDEDDFPYPLNYQKKTAQSMAELEAQYERIQQEMEQARKEMSNAASREAFLEKAKQKAGGWLQKGKGLLGRAKGALGGLLEDNSGGIVNRTGGAIEIGAAYPGDSGGTFFVCQNTTDQDVTVRLEPFYTNGLPIGNNLLGIDFNVFTVKAGGEEIYIVMNAGPEEIGKLVVSLK
ncbi:MAG: FKBP-type peptidyl-prolyl cis-trans isomerase N-terminal domain-containing protein [Spirochaetaceae bacterium]|jgi:hypothetical protein|nr:FKBP-type peptidyl-prolyl cis-trans isomerase N-terminal domain-containing protein [Spirochaetaceae bacterium]